jgi:hypothetical protein
MSNPWEIQTVEYDRTNNEGNSDNYGYGQMSILLSKYVLKEKGKGLSSNDFTDADVQKLNSVESGSQVNKLETLTVNHGPIMYPNDEKNINITIPTKNSQLENDSGYAKSINTSQMEDFSDSYVGKAKFAFQEEESLAIGKNANADNDGIAIGKNARANVSGVAIGANTRINETYDVNINNKLYHNAQEDIWEGKITESAYAHTNENGTNLTQLDVVINGLAIEIGNRRSADTTLQNNINTEIQNRTNADESLQNDIDLEIQNRINGDESLQNDIDTETERINGIEDLIPNQATCSNQLADKSFVNSSIQTATANFRGNWANWMDVPTSESSYPEDYRGSKTPTVNDYLVVQDASDYILESLYGTWRFKYNGTWATDGKEGWIPEYQVNETPFTSEQLYAINSGITHTKVVNYDNHLSNTNNPHSVTKSQVGLGNVCNVGTDNCVTQGSTNNVTSGAVYTAICNAVSCVGTVCICDTSANCNIPIALCTDVSSVGKSTNCSLTYNPYNGVLCAECFCGQFDGLITCAKCATYVKIESTQEDSAYNVTFVCGTDGDFATLNVGVILYNPNTQSLKVPNINTNCVVGYCFTGTACCSEYSHVSEDVCINSVNDNNEYNIGFVAVSTGLDTATLRYASAHPITYNPSTCTMTSPKIKVCCSIIQYNPNSQSLEFNI